MRGVPPPPTGLRPRRRTHLAVGEAVPSVGPNPGWTQPGPGPEGSQLQKETQQTEG